VFPKYDYWHYRFGPQFAGAVVLIVSLMSARRRFSLQLEELPRLGSVLVSASLAVY